VRNKEDYLKDQTLVNSIIGNGTRFRGDLILQGLLRIDGDFEGSIETNGRILVGKEGRARCILNAETVVVGGVVKGEIKATRKVVLLSTCAMIGNISTPELIIEEGVLLHGHCTVSKRADVLASAPQSEQAKFIIDWGSRQRKTPASLD